MPSASSSRARPAPRGRRYDSGVYLRRRLFVLGTALALVWIIARALTASSDGSDGGAAKDAGAAVVQQAGAEVAPSSAAPTTAAPAVPSVPVDPSTQQPQGPCKAEQVVVDPSVAAGSAAGQNVAITLTLTTRTPAPCTFQVAADTVAVTVRTGGEPVWTTGQCAGVLPPTPTVLRRDQPTVVTLTWNAKRSDEGCTGRTTWVLPGAFTVAAAALGGEPSSSDFTLGKPAVRTVEVTVAPTEKASAPVN